MTHVRRFVAAFCLLVLAWLVLVFIQVTLAANEAIDRRASLDIDVDVDGAAVVVLGAAQYNGEPSPVLQARLDTAYETRAELGEAPIVTTGANQPGDVFTEGFAGYRYLRNRGVPDESIIVIVDGGDTWESLLAVANQLLPERSVVVLVTDAFHARRTFETAREVGFEATVVAADADAPLRLRVRESVGVAIGRLLGYNRLSRYF